MKKTKRFVSFMLIAALVLGIMLSGVYIPAWADSSISADDTVKLVSDYADDRVIVVMNQTVSRNFKTYTEEDFPEVDCKTVRNLMPDLEKMVVEKINQTKTAEAAVAYDKSASSFKRDLDVDAYRQILCLELEKTGKENVWAAIKKLSIRDDILCVEPDYCMELESEAITVNDTYFNRQWGLEYSNLPDAWGLVTGTSTVLVGVIDSGIDADPDGCHPDLEGRVDVGRSRSFLLGTTEEGGLYDGRGHGTHVAGIIAAVGNNNEGIRGVSHNANVKVVSLRAVDPDGRGFASHVMRAINYASTQQIPIINLSLGYRVVSGQTTPLTYDNHAGLLSAMTNYPGLFVCSAGNNDENTDATNIQHYPSEYNLDNIISVGAYSEGYNIVSSSNYGVNSVDIFAPGGGILSCYPRNLCSNNCNGVGHCSFGYHYKTGTSMAAPFVTGVAALIKVQYPTLSPTQIKARILRNAYEIDSFYNYCQAGGVLDAFGSLMVNG